MSCVSSQRMTEKMHRAMEENPTSSYFFVVPVQEVMRIQELLEGEGYTLQRIPPGERL